MIVVLIGMPGCGKGTQASLLLKQMQCEHVAVGNVLRSYCKKSNNLAKKIRSIIDQGDLLDDNIVNQIVLDAVSSSKSKNFILDGYPRKLSQAKFLEDNFPNKKILYIYFKIKEETLINRLLSRLTCLDCSLIFSEHNALSDNYVCPQCSSNNISKREDDDLDTIKKRINIFNEETLPIVEFYSSRSNFISIDSTDNIENISTIVFNFIKTH